MGPRRPAPSANPQSKERRQFPEVDAGLNHLVRFGGYAVRRSARGGFEVERGKNAGFEIGYFPGEPTFRYIIYYRLNNSLLNARRYKIGTEFANLLISVQNTYDKILHRIHLFWPTCGSVPAMMTSKL